MKVTNMKNTDGLPLHCLPARVRFIYILLLGILFGVIGWNGHAYAEGSRSLYPSNYLTLYPLGSRADLDLEPGAVGALNQYVGKVTRSGFIYVYAQQGEYIVLGSRNRVYQSATNGDIAVYNPTQNFGIPGAENFNAATPGTPDFTCSGGLHTAPPGGTPSSYYDTGGTVYGLIATRAQELAGPKSADNSMRVTNGYTPCAYYAQSTGIYGVLF